MCGIVAIHQRRAPVDATVFHRMRETLTHRGPDDAGTWISEDGLLALGHRRLSILDLSPMGRQPMELDDLRIVFNGEIYNHTIVRAILETDGVHFRSHSDTEVILAAYRKWGVDCLDRLDGMFAFCLYDPHQNLLFLARDRAGEKPLFVASSSDRFACASELKALFADPAQPRRINQAGLNWYLAYGMVPNDSCLIEGISKLPAAHAGIYNLGTGAWHCWRYWDLPEPDPHAGHADEEELANQLCVLLEESVRQRLVADVPVGILLSGGLDSSLITAIAARSVGRVRTFTIAFPGHKQQDESPYARMVAEHFGTDHTVLDAEPASVDLLPLLARQYDEPLCDSSMVPTFLVSRLIRSQATVALGGDGGDELFGGYGHYPWVARHDAIRKWLPGPARSSIGWAAERILPVGCRGRNYLRALAGPLAEAYAGVNHFFTVRDRRWLLGSAFAIDPQPEIRKAAACAYEYGVPGLAMVGDFRTYLCDDILVKVDRASMMTSLEVRAPWLARDIIEFAFRCVPNHLRVDNGRPKILPKILAKRLLPDRLDIERKQGFSLPLADWMSGTWGGFMEEILRETPEWLLSRQAISSLFDGQRKGRHNGERIFGLTMLELWRREYNISP